MRLALVLLIGCTAKAPETLPNPDPAQLEEWSGIVRGMRMDLIDDQGKIVRERASVLELLEPNEPAIVALWATYCPPCLEEIPMLEELHDSGHRVIGVSLDSDALPEVSKVLAERKPSYPQGVLQLWSMKKVGLSLESGIPFTIVLDERGRARYLFRGKSTKPRLLAALERARS